VSINQDGTLVRVTAIATNKHRREVEMLLVRLLSEGSQLNFGPEGSQLTSEPLAHANDIGTAGLVGRDGRNGDGLAETLNEGIGKVVDLLEVSVELRGHFSSLMRTDGV
jgi:hypothetical protein